MDNTVIIERVVSNIEETNYFSVKGSDINKVRTFPFKLNVEAGSIWHEDIAKAEAIEYATKLRDGEVITRETIEF